MTIVFFDSYRLELCLSGLKSKQGNSGNEEDAG